MIITLTNCPPKLQAKMIDFSLDGISKLDSDLRSLLGDIGWTYFPSEGTMTIEVADGTTVPDGLTQYGDVML